MVSLLLELDIHRGFLDYGTTLELKLWNMRHCCFGDSTIKYFVATKHKSMENAG